MNGLRRCLIRRLLPENVKSKSKIFSNFGNQVAIVFKIGLMKGSTINIEQKLDKYKLINSITINDYLIFGPDRLKEIKEYYN